jgi:hypothetical protein
MAQKKLNKASTTIFTKERTKPKKILNKTSETIFTEERIRPKKKN